MKRYKPLFEETKESLNATIEKAKLEIKQQQITLANLDTSKPNASDRKKSIADTISKQKEIISSTQAKIKELGK
jgi:hypothetical protein